MALKPQDDLSPSASDQTLGTLRPWGFANILNLGDGLGRTVSTASLFDKITYGTADLVAGTSPLATGSLYIVYE